MPRRCCVPNCRSNRYSSLKKNISYITTFVFPRDENLKQKWLHAMSLDDFQPSLSSVVCCKHFTDNDIIRYDKRLLPDGSLQPLLLRRPKLNKEAVPSLFENVPSNLSTKDPKTPEAMPQQMKQVRTCYNQFFIS